MNCFVVDSETDCDSLFDKGLGCFDGLIATTTAALQGLTSSP
jgi:hypothetical protein